MEGAAALSRTLLNLLSLSLTALANICGVFCYKWTCDAFFLRRPEKKVRWITILLLAVIFTFSNLLVDPFGSPAKIIVEVGFFLLFCRRFYESRWDRRFFVIATLYALLFSSSYWLQIFAMWLFDMTQEEFIWNIPLYTGFYLARVFLVTGSTRLARHFHAPRRQNTQVRAWVPASAVFPFLTLVIVLCVQSAASHLEVLTIWQICLAILVFVDVVALLLLDRMEQAALDHESLLAAKERARAQNESLQALAQAYASQRKLTHDFRSHLQTLSALLAEKQYDAAASYLSQLEAQQNEHLLLVNSHHATMDAILNQKGYAGQRRQIDMRFTVNDLSRLRIPSMDVAIVLGNLLDNALEACEKLPKDKRWISCQVLLNTDTHNLFLSVTNPSLPVTVANGEIVSAKGNAHGFGLKNVKEILDRAHAEYDFGYEEGQFLFSVEWPEPTTSDSNN